MALIEAAARAAYPDECCGLLAGTGDAAAGYRVSRVVASANLRAGERSDRFEIDPQVHFDLIHALKNTPEEIIGHYHSHPDHPAEPSARDLEMAWVDDLVWLITAVADGIPTTTKAHMVDRRASQFHQIRLICDARTTAKQNDLE